MALPPPAVTTIESKMKRLTSQCQYDVANGLCDREGEYCLWWNPYGLFGQTCERVEREVWPENIRRRAGFALACAGRASLVECVVSWRGEECRLLGSWRRYGHGGRGGGRTSNTHGPGQHPCLLPPSLRTSLHQRARLRLFLRNHHHRSASALDRTKKITSWLPRWSRVRLTRPVP